MKKEELAERIFKKCYLEGNFKLRSGKESKYYFDKYLFESDPFLLNEITSHLLKIIPDNIDILAGLELGGIPIATSLSIKSSIPAVFVRKGSKNYGTCKIAEGPDIKGLNLCIIEDIVTTGGQVIDSCNLLRKLGANVNEVICVIQREDMAAKKLKDNNLRLTALFTLDEILSFKKG